jgi:hypothetical protein
MAIEHDFALIADNAHIDASGKLYILGEFRYIFAQSFPARHGRFSVVSRWVADMIDVRNPVMLAMEVVDADGNTVLPRSQQVELKFGPIGPANRGKAQAQLVLELAGMIVPREGAYVLHFFLNNVANGKVSFHAATALGAQQQGPN